MASPHLLEQLAAYVPTPVAQVIYHQPRLLIEPAARCFPAVVLFTDISGFTPLSELLSQAGPTGAEELTQLINQYFTRMIETAQAYQGQVIKFSGDALTVLFPAQEISMQLAVRQAGECALAMQGQMGEFANLKTSRGSASLSMKAGVGAGEVLECTIGGVAEHWEYVVGGDPLVQVAMADKQALPGQTILSPSAWQEVQSFFRGTVMPSGFVEVTEVLVPLPKTQPAPLRWSKLKPGEAEIAEKALRGYVPDAVRDRLGEQAEWLAELRRITVLFVGIGGFDYQAVDVAPRLQKFLQAIQEVVRRFEGSLNKVAVDDKGTVLLILFGAPPFSHEDDILRAVACALDLQAVAEAQGLRMAIGITEGSLFAGPVGAPSRQEYTVIGDTVNLAARLMQYGKAGTILVSQRVKERVGSHFVFESLGKIALKGKTETLAAYRVQGEQGAQDEFIIRYLLREDPLINRQAELAEMRRIAAEARQGQLHLLFLEGELGLGKSRLVSELVREWIMEGGIGYGSKCISYGRQTPYQAWREVIAALCDLTPTLTPARQLARLATTVADLEDPPGQPGYWAARLPLLADVLGLEAPENSFTQSISGQLRRNNTFALIEALLRRKAKRHALLILLEDIQWADELSLLLAAYLTKTLAGSSLLLVLSHRPMPAEDMTPLDDLNLLPYVHKLHLEPFSTDESLKLVEILLGNKKLPPGMVDILLSRGQGNPFFIQEITGALLNVADSQADQLLELSQTLNLPDTVQDVILTRIDRLSEAEKLTLKIASVIGPSFQRSLLSAIHPLQQAQFWLSSQLEDLESEKLIRLEVPAPKWEYIFRNVITQEVVYEGLLLAQRRQLHRAVGTALENLVPDEVEQLAFHYSRSDDAEKALYYLKIAGDKARREYANHAAIDHYTEILTYLHNRSSTGNGYGMVSVDYWDILMERVKLYNLIGQREEALEDLGTLGIMAEALNDDYRRALAAKQWASLYETSGDYDSGLEMVERAVQLAQKAGDEKLVGEGYSHWGKLLYLRGEYETAHDYLQRALGIAQKYQDKNAQADCMKNLGLVAHYQADYEVALYFFKEATELWQVLGDQVGLGSGLSQLGRVYYDMGQPIEAQKCYDRSLTLHRTIGDRAGEALTRRGLGKVQRTLGNYPAALQLFQEALAITQATGDRRAEVYTLYQLGFLYTRLGEYETALTLLDEALTLLREINDLWALGTALTYYGWTLHEQGEPRQAKKYFEEVLRIQRELQQEAKMTEDIAHLGRAALAANDLTLAETCARHAWSSITNQGIQGIEHPAVVYLTCFQIEQAHQRFEQAHEILRQGYAYIMAQAAQINDPALEQAYLNNIPENRTIRELMAVENQKTSGL
ncbi:MAG: tetratricopeptide repeat protein [Anaerolineales bacterium]|nr:tetratricopeptide repeat protein [Anaerolineales bacterium]